MSNTIQAINTLRAQVDEVRAAGGKTTKEYDRLTSRYDAYVERDYTAAERLAHAILGDDSMDEIHLLHGLALGEQSGSVGIANVRGVVAENLYAPLRTEYTKTAAANYDTLRARFNKTAADFIKAYETVDVDAEPAGLMSAPESDRTAWAQAAVLAQDLTGQLPALHTAARLAGANIRLHVDDRISLSVDPAGVHRRRMWEAWESEEGRTTRWGALTAAGVSITARPLDQLAPYQRAADLVTRYERAPLGQRPVLHDPEDAAHDAVRSKVTA